MYFSFIMLVGNINTYTHTITEYIVCLSVFEMVFVSSSCTNDVYYSCGLYFLAVLRKKRVRVVLRAVLHSFSVLIFYEDMYVYIFFPSLFILHNIFLCTVE